MPMKVNEIFYSIQGESSFAGFPCAFIRLTGCNLRCSYCDTGYAFYEGSEMSVPQIIDAIADFPARLVLVTGGEPMLQPEVHELFGELLGRGYTVCLETGGQVSLNAVDPRVHKIMDLKCPSSGMQQHNLYGNVECLTPGDEVKFVIGNREDFDWACGQVKRYGLPSRVGAVLFSPVHDALPAPELAAWLLESGIRARLQVQLHRILWPDRRRGA